jgi:hypothetical protein
MWSFRGARDEEFRRLDGGIMWSCRGARDEELRRLDGGIMWSFRGARDKELSPIPSIDGSTRPHSLP